MNFHDYLNRQKAEDRRAFIIHFQAKSGKTAFAQRILATRQDAYLIDMQAYWKNHPELPKPIDFNFPAFRNFLVSLDVDQSVIIIDNPDLIINTWKNNDNKDFINWLRILLRSPGDTEKTFIFILQSDQFVEEANLVNSYGESRVLMLNKFDKI